MKTTTTETISKEIVKKVTTRTTTVDENVVARLPKSIFKVKIEQGDQHSWKMFLNIDWEANWVNRITLTDYIVERINSFLCRRFIRQCANCTKGHIGLHWSIDPYRDITVKEEEFDYVILAKDITIDTETHYESFSE